MKQDNQIALIVKLRKNSDKKSTLKVITEKGILLSTEWQSDLDMTSEMEANCQLEFYTQ